VKIRTAVLLIVILALAAWGSLRILDWWAGTATDRERLEALARSAEQLKAELEAARTQAQSVREEFQESRRRHELELWESERERRALEREHAALEEEISVLRDRMDEPVLSRPEIPDVELTERIVTALLPYKPIDSGPMFVIARQDGPEESFTTNRTALEAVLAATDRLSDCLTLADRQAQQVANLEAQLSSTRTSWAKDREDLARAEQALKKSDAEREAAARLSANEVERLREQAELIRKLERKLWVRKLQTYGGAAAAFAAGYLIGRSQ